MFMDKGTEYIERIDTKVSQMTTEEILKSRAKMKQIQISNTYQNFTPLFEYIEVSMEEELILRAKKTNPEITVTPSISENDKLKAQKEILEMQKLFASSLKDNLGNMISLLEESINYEEIWNFDMSLQVDIEDTIFKSGLSLKDYTIQNQALTQSMSAELLAFLDGIISGEKVDLELSTFIDYINKDGNMYLLLQELSIENNENKELIEDIMKEIIDTLNQLGKEKTYLAIEDPDSQVVLQIFEAGLNNLSLWELETQIDLYTSEALLEAYSKDWNSYLLRPSKRLCDIGKELSGRFDPFFDNSLCSESQYQSLLKDFSRSGTTISLTPDSINNLEISLQDTEAIGSLNVEWNSVLHNISFEIYNPSNIEDTMVLEFIPKESLILKMKIEENEVDMFLSLILWDTGVEEIDMNMSIEGDFQMSWIYRDEILTIDINNDGPRDKIICTIAWRLVSDYADLIGKCDIKSERIEFLFPGQDSANIDIKLFSDALQNKNNLNFDLWVDIGLDSIFDINIQNTWTRVTPSLSNIIVPEKIIPLEDAFKNINPFNFDNGSESWFEQNWDNYYKVDTNTWELLICSKYEYNEVENYDYCREYIPETP